ncbi:MAG TPA: hypothetical protein VF168_09460 [Trueperaceae bacterium]
MRKLLAVIVLTLIPSLASAQEGYAGVQFGAGFLSGLVAAPVSAQVGFEVAPMIDVRADLGFYLTGTGIQFGANGLGKFDLASATPVTAYGGGGPRVLLDSNGGGAVFGLGGLGGAEYMLTDQVGVFGEGGFDVFFAGLAVSIFKLGAGANFHF